MVDTANIYPEIMHLDQLNIAKQSWTKGPLRLMSAHMRIVSVTFFKGIGFKLDCKLKSDGRSGTAWFKASQWNEACRGSEKVPGGLPPWMSSLLFYIVEDFLEKQISIRPLSVKKGVPCSLLAHGLPSTPPRFIAAFPSPIRRLGRGGDALALWRQREGNLERGADVRQVHRVAQHQLPHDSRRRRKEAGSAGKRDRRCVHAPAHSIPEQASPAHDKISQRTQRRCRYAY